MNSGGFTVILGAAYQVTVGKGGRGADSEPLSNIKNNTPGRISSFGSLLTAAGGETQKTVNGPGANGGSGAGGSCNGGSPGGCGGTNGGNGGKGSYAGGIGQGSFATHLALFKKTTFTAGKGGAGGTSTHSAGGGGGGVLLNGEGPSGQKGGAPFSGDGGEGDGGGVGCGRERR